MLALPPESLSLPLAFSLGLLYGLGPCLLSCLPYLGPVLLSSDGGLRQSWQVLLPLSAGRLTVYAGFGAVSGWWGSRFVAGVAPWTVALTLGLALLLAGLALLLRRRGGCAGRACGGPAAPSRPLLTSGLYLLGVGMALTPCAPLSAILLGAAASASPLGGALLGLAFGLGACLAPGLVYGLGVAY
ncbi:MAG: hypothetical protein RIR00_2376, partial [Pseudomonadota bacterium]